jgi:K+-transporting ATPase ATPase A chain
LDLSFLDPLWAIGLPIAGSIPLGWWMARVLDPPAERVGKGIDAVSVGLLKLLGHREPAKMGWKQYARAVLAFNAALFVISFVLLLLQGHAPFLNPDSKGPLTALGYKDTAGVEHPGADTAVIFNTVCSFVTNTNLQHYSGEQHLSYFSQLGAIVWLQFVTPACGLAVMLAVIRGLRGQHELGDFYLDTLRSLCFVLLPLSLVVAVALVASGVPMTLHGATQAATLERGTQAIAVGPVAAEVAIKQLGTNGGGFFGPNAAHPYENPSPWSNLLEVISIIIVPMASIVMFGLMIRERAHAAVIYGVMLAMLLVGATVAIVAETQSSAAVAGLPVQKGGNLEGKDLRLGPVASATWSATRPVRA